MIEIKRDWAINREGFPLKRIVISILLGFFMLFSTGMPAFSQLTSVVAISTTAKLMAYNEAKLDNRMPLILIHGIGGKEGSFYKWDNFLEYAENNPDFEKRFKVYLFEYDTSRSVPEISTAIRDTLRTFITENNYPKFRVLAFSEGGLVYRNAMQDPVIFSHTDKVITVASPFQGSPLANEEWLSKQMKANEPFSLMSLTHRISYAIAAKKHPSFREDFTWLDLNTQNRSDANLYALNRHQNFIAYGSYFGVNEAQHLELFKKLDVKQSVPQENGKLKHLFSKHFFFNLVQDTLANIPKMQKQVASRIIPALKKNKPEMAGNEEAVAMMAQMEDDEPALRQLNAIYAMLVYNDGISPINSTLWLGRYTPVYRMDTVSERNWAALRGLKGKQKARLFHSMDHANWMTGENRSRQPKLKDLLNPDVPAKTVFEWYLYDLTS